MQIVVGLGDNGMKEWFCIEMQGDLESRNKEHLEGKFIGDLHFTKQGVPIMIIGHHILYGKFMELDQPFIAVNKEAELDEADMDIEDGASTSYTISAVIKRKIIFKARPKPIIANVPKQLSEK